MSVCTKCRLRKSVGAFHRNKNRPDGLCGHCKQCRSADAKKRNSAPEVKARQGRLRATLKVKVKERLRKSNKKGNYIHDSLPGSHSKSRRQAGIATWAALFMILLMALLLFALVIKRGIFVEHKMCCFFVPYKTKTGDVFFAPIVSKFNRSDDPELGRTFTDAFNVARSEYRRINRVLNSSDILSRQQLKPSNPLFDREGVDRTGFGEVVSIKTRESNFTWEGGRLAVIPHFNLNTTFGHLSPLVFKTTRPNTGGLQVGQFQAKGGVGGVAGSFSGFLGGTHAFYQHVFLSNHPNKLEPNNEGKHERKERYGVFKRLCSEPANIGASSKWFGIASLIFFGSGIAILSHRRNQWGQSCLILGLFFFLMMLFAARSL